jgi:hypothetical protein
MDGGARSPDNADLATGYARILIVSPMGTTTPTMAGGSLREQIDLLENSGGTTYLVEPDEASKSAIGANPLSPTTRTPAAEAGRRMLIVNRIATLRRAKFDLAVRSVKDGVNGVWYWSLPAVGEQQQPMKEAR